MATSNLTVTQYNCSSDGIPNLAVIAGQGPGHPDVEFQIPFFADCVAADDRVPFEVTAGLPEQVSSLLTSQITDSNGFTGTEQAESLASFFPIGLVQCVAILSRGVIKVFNSTVPTTMSGNGEAVAVRKILCGR